MSLRDEFIESGGAQEYRFRLGTLIATSLSGFIAGVIAASIVWLLLIIAERI